LEAAVVIRIPQIAGAIDLLPTLAACAGNQSRAAKLLDMPRRTFVAKLDRYNIPRPNKG